MSYSIYIWSDIIHCAGPVEGYFVIMMLRPPRATIYRFSLAIIVIRISKYPLTILDINLRVYLRKGITKEYLMSCDD